MEKSASLAELKKGIEIVASGACYFGPEVAHFLIAEKLNISFKTVENHRFQSNEKTTDTRHRRTDPLCHSKRNY